MTAGAGRGAGRRPVAYDLVLSDGSRVPVDGTVSIGRAPGSDVRLDDRSVSRRHARITTMDGAVPVLQDDGSTYGTWVDGGRVRAQVTLRDGARIRLGDQELVVERRRTDSEAGLTIVVPDAAARGDTETRDASDRPRLRPGYALKRLEGSERPYRWVLRDTRSDRFMRLSDDDGRLLALLDGRRSVLELASAAEERFGPGAAVRMLALLPELGERGFLDGVAGPAQAPVARGPLTRLLRPREAVWPGAGRCVERLYRGGGRRLLSSGALLAMAVVAAVGLVAFGELVLGRYGTPFVVADKVGLGGLVFVAGRVAVSAVHELAHGLVLSSFGRRVGRAGLKVILIFPFAFVDTSEAWFEPRRRRIAVSAAGPAADAVLGGLFACASLMLGPGALRDVFFQLALAAYVATLVNLNPFVERDGYHILADVLGEPGLRRRARVELRRRLGGLGPGPASRVLAPYALAGLVWSLVAAAAAVVVSLRYAPALRVLVPAPVVSAMLACLWAGVLAPLVVVVWGPLLDRVRRRGAVA